MAAVARRARPTVRARWSSDKISLREMLCAAIDIGSNTTRVLVAEPDDGQLRKVMEQRAYTRIVKSAKKKDGSISAGKVAEVADVVATQVRLAQELGAEAIRIVATAAVREAEELRRGRCRDRGRGGLPRRRPQRARRGPARVHRRDEGPRSSRSTARSASSTSAAAPPR